jgi:transcriptional regulator with XRE-family HTH domain
LKSLNWIDIGSRIKELRQRNKITIERLCEIIGVSPSFIGLIERGDSGISVDNLYKLSQVFDVSVDYLLTGTSAVTERSRFDVLISNIYDYTEKEIDSLITLSKFIDKHYNVK